MNLVDAIQKPTAVMESNTAGMVQMSYHVSVQLYKGTHFEMQGFI